MCGNALFCFLHQARNCGYLVFVPKYYCNGNREPASFLVYSFRIITVSVLNICSQIFWKSQGPSDRPKMNEPFISSIACWLELESISEVSV